MGEWESPRCGSLGVGVLGSVPLSLPAGCSSEETSFLICTMGVRAVALRGVSEDRAHVCITSPCTRPVTWRQGRRRARGSRGTEEAGGRGWKLGPLPDPGPSYSFLHSSSGLYSPTQEAQLSKEMGRSWGYPLLGAAELALKLPKMGDQGSWETSPPISWQRWVPRI